MSFLNSYRHVLYLQQYQNKMNFPKYSQTKSIPSKIQSLRMGLDHFELEIESEASKIETVLQTKKGVLYAAIPSVFSYVNAT